jgi:hypothetical protein
MPPVIHLIFKTHLDVGFTDFAAAVLDRYLHQYIPQAIATARLVNRPDGPKRFVWTTGSWLIYEFLEKASPELRVEMEKAILDGDIAWHALPFTTHTELMDAGLFRLGLSLSQELDRRFGKHTIAAKMTDVPGHTRGIVPLLVEAGIQFLHIGVNPASRPPDVPPVFRWRDPGGAEVMVMYHKGSYGDWMTVPGLEEAIAFAHTNDNLGPQSTAEVNHAYQKLEAAFPGCRVQASTLDAFARRLGTVKATLPLVEQEIGDTWIYGVGSDPMKVAQFRQLLRLRAGWDAQGRVSTADERLKAFQRFLLMVPEHTWGMDEKTHLDDYRAYGREDFQQARSRPNFRKFEASWQEQRGYIRSAVDALEDAVLKDEAEQALQSLVPVPANLDEYVEVTDMRALLETPAFDLGLDSRGALVHLRDKNTGQRWAAPDHPLGLFRYQTFSQQDYDRYYRQYVVNKRQVANWAVADQTKPGIAAAGAVHKEWQPVLRRVLRAKDPRRQAFLLELAMPDECTREYGCPSQITTGIEVLAESQEMRFNLQWFHKPACRLPEAIWFSFSPRVKHPHQWKLDKLGERVSPYGVIKNGGRHLHCVGWGVKYEAQDGALGIETVDAPLVAPGDPSLLNFHNRPPALSRGVHFLLYNNVWGTNFPMWYEDDACFRFQLHFEFLEP